MTKQEILDKIEELKKQKREAEDLAGLQDVFQHSFKIFLNSVYGFTGTQYSPVFNKDMAESVTLTGQNVIKEMVRFTNRCLNKIGGTSDDAEWVVAGDTDSVSSKSKVTLNRREMTIAEAFEKIAGSGTIDKLENGTEVAIPTMDTFITDTLNRKDLVRNISRHKVSKRMYEISVPGQHPLTITEDHSIMVMRNGKIRECKPSKLKKGDKIIVRKT